MADQPSFLGEPPMTDEAAALFDANRDEDGYVQNYTRLWSWRPDVHAAFAALRRDLMSSPRLTEREWALLVTATASELTDSYCSFAWGARLATLSGDETAAQVIAGATSPSLTERETALVEWARRVARDPNGTTKDDVARLRDVGLDDQAIFEATAFVAFRLAFSTVNDALGAAPDKQLADGVPDAVRAAVTYGRPPSPAPSST